MRRLHLSWSALGLVVFLATGYHMTTLFTETWTGGDAQRLLHRSAHIYILFSSLLNAFAAMLYSSVAGWRIWGQRVASSCLLLTTILFVLAFFFEHPTAELKRPHTLPGVALSILGVLLLVMIHRRPSTNRS